MTCRRQDCGRGRPHRSNVSFWPWCVRVCVAPMAVMFTSIQRGGCQGLDGALIGKGRETRSVASGSARRKAGSRGRHWMTQHGPPQNPLTPDRPDLRVKPSPRQLRPASDINQDILVTNHHLKQTWSQSKQPTRHAFWSLLRRGRLHHGTH